MSGYSALNDTPMAVPSSRKTKAAKTYDEDSSFYNEEI